ncbi:MAG: hypothetical protein SGILL_002676 [Bacillariaceae sp.]
MAGKLVQGLKEMQTQAQEQIAADKQTAFDAIDRYYPVAARPQPSNGQSFDHPIHHSIDHPIEPIDPMPQEELIMSPSPKAATTQTLHGPSSPAKMPPSEAKPPSEASSFFPSSIATAASSSASEAKPPASEASSFFPSSFARKRDNTDETRSSKRMKVGGPFNAEDVAAAIAKFPPAKLQEASTPGTGPSKKPYAPKVGKMAFTNAARSPGNQSIFGGSPFASPFTFAASPPPGLPSLPGAPLSLGAASTSTITFGGRNDASPQAPRLGLEPSREF